MVEPSGRSTTPCRNGGILISFVHKKQQRNDDERFFKLLNGELAEGFPNPKRIGCPNSEFLQRLARHQVPISEFDPWTDHLGSAANVFESSIGLKWLPVAAPAASHFVRCCSVHCSRQRRTPVAAIEQGARNVLALRVWLRHTLRGNR